MGIFNDAGMVVARGRAQWSAPLPDDVVWYVVVAGDAVWFWVEDGTDSVSEGFKPVEYFKAADFAA